MVKCKICKAEFVRRSMSHKTCSIECAMEYVCQLREKNERKMIKARKLAIKPRSKWLKEAQAAFNCWIKERDFSLPCISCGRHHQGQYHAGHWLSVGARPGLRFNEKNVWKQCAPCNVYLSGNLINFRIELINRIGIAAVEALESNHAQVRYSIDQLKSIAKEYKIKSSSLRRLRNEL